MTAHSTAVRILPFMNPRFTIEPMSQALPIPPPGFDALSIDDKIDYVQSLWDRIATRPEDVPVPDWHREIINERLAAHRDGKEQGKEWEEVEREITAELAHRTK